jgi:hypothetical protein
MAWRALRPTRRTAAAAVGCQPVRARGSPGRTPSVATSHIKGEPTPSRAFTLAPSSVRQPPRAMGAATGEHGRRSFPRARS